MDLTEMLSALGGTQSMARELGISEAQARSGAEALLPAILGGFKKHAQSQSGGLDGLLNTVSGLGGGSLIDEVLAPRPTDLNRGNDVLGQIFGTREVSRTVAQNAAAPSGLDPALLKKMLPMVAMLVAGIVAKQGGSAPRAPAGGGLLDGLIGGNQPAGSGGLASMLDFNRDGNPLDDIIGMAGRYLR